MSNSNFAKVSDEAARWCIRLEGETTPEIWEAFTSWMDRDPRHRAAFVRMKAVWRHHDLLREVRPLEGTIDPDLLASASARVPSRLPGGPLLKLSRVIFSARTFHLYVAPVIADMQHEYVSANTNGEFWLARWIVVRGYLTTLMVQLLRLSASVVFSLRSLELTGSISIPILAGADSQQLLDDVAPPVRIKFWLTRILSWGILGWGIVGGSALLVLLARISEADILLETPHWLKRSIGLLLAHGQAVGFVLVVTGAILLMLRAYLRYIARANAKAIFPLITENLKQIEDQIAVYMQTWKLIESRVNNPRFHWQKRVGPWWAESVERLNGAYRGFEDLAEQLLFCRPDFPPLAPTEPPEVSHVRPDAVRQQFKQLWLEHQQRMAAIDVFREHWNRTLTEAAKVVEQDVRRAASAGSRQEPLRRAPSSEARQ